MDNGMGSCPICQMRPDVRVTVLPNPPLYLPCFIKGRIVDEEGNPIPGARVRITRGRTGYTKGDGRFKIKTRCNCKKTITITVEGYDPRTITLHTCKNVKDFGTIVLTGGEPDRGDVWFAMRYINPA